LTQLIKWVYSGGMVNQRSGPVAETPAEAAVLTAVLAAGPIARSDIARRTGLSTAAVTRATQPLLEAGYLRYAPDAGTVHDVHARAVMGRPSQPLVVEASRAGAIGIKLTADESIGVVCDLSGSVRICQCKPLSGRSVDAVLADVDGHVKELIAAANHLGFMQSIRDVGLSVAGDVDHATGVVRYSPFLGWRDVDLGELVAERTNARVVVENDVKALAVAEQWFGLARGLQSFALVTIGAGIGCALIVNGALVRGSQSVAGEIGHLPVGDPAVLCHCGAHGCVEAEASVDAITSRCRQVAGDPDLSFDAAVARARGGDLGVAAVFARAGHLIGLSIASMVNLLGPEQVIISGEGVASYDLLADAIREGFTQQVFGSADRTVLHLQPLSFEAWARGAAAVALEELAFPFRDPNERRAVWTSYGQ